jgi:acetamidase/formamidase
MTSRIPLVLASLPFLLAAETHRVQPTRYYRTFFHGHPVLERLRPGDRVATTTIDASGYDEQNIKRSEPFNPLTGPVYVEGAEPGDALVVRFERVHPTRAWGFTNFRLLLSSLLPDAVVGIYSNRYKKDLVRPGVDTQVPWDLDLERGVARLREPASARMKMELPLKPMLGCVGVAPAGDFAPTSGPSGSYGGNMDYNEIGEGATVYLPVYHPGGLLFIGDGHALQGDGEPTGTGIEVPMEVEFTVDLRKAAKLGGPRVQTAEYLISVGSQPEFSSSLDRGLQIATTDMIRWLASEYGLEDWAAHLLVGYQAKYDVVTVMGSMALKIPKRVLPAPR